jgi:hypothetical protein
MSKEEFGHDEVASPRYAESFVENAELERRCVSHSGLGRTPSHHLRGFFGKLIFD